MFHVEHSPQETDRKLNTMRSIFRRAAVAVAALTVPAMIVACQGGKATATPAPTPRPTASVTPADPTAELWPLVDVTSAHYMHDLADLIAPRVGDDNRDGVIREGESGFKCRTMGNKRCAKRPLLAPVVCTAKRVKVPGTWRPVTLNKVPPKLIPACAKLAGKPARWDKYQGAAVYVPKGSARVIECREQYTGTELQFCLNQK